MKTKEKEVFAALKLIEQLFADGCIPDYVYNNIKREYAVTLDLSQFIPGKELSA